MFYVQCVRQSREENSGTRVRPRVNNSMAWHGRRRKSVIMRI
jgi:hypothetical protein